MEVHKVLCLPRNLHMEVHKVLRLPRESALEETSENLITMDGRPTMTRDRLATVVPQS